MSHGKRHAEVLLLLSVHLISIIHYIDTSFQLAALSGLGCILDHIHRSFDFAIIVTCTYRRLGAVTEVLSELGLSSFDVLFSVFVV